MEQPINVISSQTSMSSEINEIASALSKAQSELESARKDSTGYGYNYSDLATVIATAKPILAKHELAITQLVGETGSNVSVETILTHSSGQYFTSKGTLPIVEMNNPAQGAGAAISYLRRYAYQAILGLASEDNDAAGDPKKGVKKPAKKDDFRKNKGKQIEL